MRARAIRRRLSSDLTGRSSLDRILFERGFGGSPLAPFASRGSTDPSSTDVLNMKHRLPVLLKLSNGSYAAFWQGHNNYTDNEVPRFYCAVSADACRTFGQPKLVYVLPDYNSATKWLGLGSVGCDASGKVHLLFVKVIGVGGVLVSTQQWYMSTTDLTLATASWTAPVDISGDVNAAGDVHFVFGPGQIIQLQGGSFAGHLVASVGRRHTVSPATIWPHIVYSSNGGANWALGSGADEADPNNDNLLEPAICEIGSSGRIYINCRGKDSAVRKHTVFTDPTTGTFPVDFVPMTDGSANIGSYNVPASAVSLPNGDLIVVTGNNAGTALRGRTTAFLSTNAKTLDNPTFPASRVLNYGWSGYSGLVYLGSGKAATLFERTIARDEESAEGITVPMQYLWLARFSKKFVQRTLAQTPDVIEFHFNEATSGLVSAQGAPIKDHGTHDCRITGFGATMGTWNSGFLAFDASGVGLTLQPLQYAGGEVKGGAWDLGTDDFTLAMRLRAPSATGTLHTILSSRNVTSGTTVGFSMHVTATLRNLVFALANGTVVNTIVAKTGFGDDAWHNVYITRSGGFLRAWVDNDDGVFVAATPVAESLGSVIGQQKVRLGSTPDGTTSRGSFDISYLKLTRGVAIASGHAALGSIPKVAPLVLAGNVVISPTLPTSYADCQLALGASWNGGIVGCDLYGGFDWGRMPPVAGQGVSSMRDLIGSKLFRGDSTGRMSWWENNSKIGWCIRNRTLSGGASNNFMRRTSDVNGAKLVDSAFDFVQNTVAWSMAMVIEFVSSTGTFQYLLTTNDGSGVGFYLIRQPADGDISLYVSDGTGTFNQTFNANTALGTPYYIGVTMNGAGNPGLLYLGAYTAGPTPPTLGAPLSLGSFYTPTPAAATKALSITSTSVGTLGADVRWKNVLLFNAALSAGQHQEWANLGVS